MGSLPRHTYGSTHARPLNGLWRTCIPMMRVVGQPHHGTAILRQPREPECYPCTRDGRWLYCLPVIADPLCGGKCANPLIEAIVCRHQRAVQSNRAGEIERLVEGNVVLVDEPICAMDDLVGSLGELMSMALTIPGPETHQNKLHSLSIIYPTQ